MDEEPKTHDLSREKLARLWEIGADMPAGATDGTPRADECYAERLRDWWVRPPPPDPALQQLLLESWGPLGRTVRPFAGDSIGGLLTNPQTDLEVLKMIKNHAKERGTATASRMEREVALTVYFAAIAGALVFHHARISQHNDRKLQGAFDSLSIRAGIPAALSALFQKARQSVTSVSDAAPENEGNA